MTGFIRTLYEEELKPKEVIEHSTIKIINNRSYISQHEAELFKRLSKEEQNLLAELSTNWDELLEICKEESFVAGFRMGAQFMQESLKK